jgi:hypothetical protein
VHLSSIEVEVTLMRNAGRWLTWNQKPRGKCEILNV